MYNFNFVDDEKLISVFDEVFIKQDINEKIFTVALTDKRLLFLDYITNDGMEALRITKGIDFNKYKEVIYQINLEEIDRLVSDEYYQIILKNKRIINFNNEILYNMIKTELNF